jgi:sulfite reductase beta subunit-like hemoprotein
VFRWIDQKNLNNIFWELNKSNLSVLGANTICDVLGCPGADTCNLGVTRSHRLAMKLSEHLLEHEKDIFSKEFEDANINISGCPNACAHNHIATIGLFGSAQRVNGQMTPFYQLQLGGAVTNGNVKFGEHSIRIPAKKVPEAISKLMSLYRSERQDNETFKSWINRLRLGSEEKVG